MRAFRITLAYDGSGFFGWQTQPGKRTVQGTVEAVWRQITGEPIRLVASGRTDAGVHALAQVASCNSRTRLSCETLCRALNAELPAEIGVLEVAEAPHGFHALRDARGKRYRYVIQDGRPRDVFSRDYAWYIVQRLDETAMQAAATTLLGRQDFAALQTAGSARVSTVRTITDVDVRRPPDPRYGRLVVEVAADGFLYNMVRNIVGSLVEVGRGKRPPEWLSRVLASGDRRLAGATAPPQGLFLVEVHYD